jgi:hypothetical protein
VPLHSEGPGEPSVRPGISPAQAEGFIAPEITSTNTAREAHQADWSADKPDEKEKIVAGFVRNLHALVSSPNIGTIHWSADGLSFFIEDVYALEEVLPRFFRHRQVSSLIRQCNSYSIRRVAGTVGSIGANGGT